MTSKWSRSPDCCWISRSPPPPNPASSAAADARHDTCSGCPGPGLAGGRRCLRRTTGGRRCCSRPSAIHDHRLPAHNIGGLALSPETPRHLVVSHQVLNSAARTTGSDVFWGLLITNTLRRIPIRELLSEQAFADSTPLGRDARTGRQRRGGSGGAGDPGRTGHSSWPSRESTRSGSGDPESFELTRIPTGTAPHGALAGSADERRAVVTSTLDDRLDLLDLEHARQTPRQHLAGTSQPEVEPPTDRGERTVLRRTGCHETAG